MKRLILSEFKKFYISDKQLKHLKPSKPWESFEDDLSQVCANFASVFIKYFNTILIHQGFQSVKWTFANGKCFADLTQERGEESSGYSCSKHTVKASFLFDVL